MAHLSKFDSERLRDLPDANVLACEDVTEIDLAATDAPRGHDRDGAIAEGVDQLA